MQVLLRKINNMFFTVLTYFCSTIFDKNKIHLPTIPIKYKIHLKILIKWDTEVSKFLKAYPTRKISKTDETLKYFTAFRNCFFVQSIKCSIVVEHTMEVLAKGLLIGAAVVVAALTIAVEWYQHRHVPQPYDAHGRRPNRN